METTSRARRRATTFRRIGWLAVAAMTTLALVGPAAGPVAAAGPTDPGPGNPTCTDVNSAWTLQFKIDTGTLENRTYEWDEGLPVVSNWTDQAISISGLSGGGQTFNWSSTLPVSGVLVKAGNDNHALYTYIPPATSDTGLTHGPNQQVISHVTFCGTVGTTTTTTTTDSTTTTDTTTGTTTATTTATTTQATTTQATTTQATTTQATTTQATTQATTTQATTTQATTTQATTTQATTTQATTTEGDQGGVLGATATPNATPPPTDTLPTSGTPGGDSWRLALLAIAGLLATLLLLAPATPAKARRRR